MWKALGLNPRVPIWPLRDCVKGGRLAQIAGASRLLGCLGCLLCHLGSAVGAQKRVGRVKAPPVRQQMWVTPGISRRKEIRAYESPAPHDGNQQTVVRLAADSLFATVFGDRGWKFLRVMWESGVCAMRESVPTNGLRRKNAMDKLGTEPRASRMLSGCRTTTPCAP